MPEPSRDPDRRRRLVVVLIILVGIVFVVQIAALALGRTVLSAVCAALLILAWFVLRSFVRRREREA